MQYLSDALNYCWFRAKVAAGVGLGSATAQMSLSCDNLCQDTHAPLPCVPCPIRGCGDALRHRDSSHLCPALPGTWACCFYPFLTRWLVPLPFGPSLSWARFIVLQAQPWFLLELLDAATASTITRVLDRAGLSPSLVDRDVVMG